MAEVIQSQAKRRYSRPCCFYPKVEDLASSRVPCARHPLDRHRGPLRHSPQKQRAFLDGEEETCCLAVCAVQVRKQKTSIKRVDLILLANDVGKCDGSSVRRTEANFGACFCSLIPTSVIRTAQKNKCTVHAMKKNWHSLFQSGKLSTRHEAIAMIL